ncbi:MAG TPA: caspase family protein [Pyrinomonadaceae bacterium]|nr:caspase family protein [Pyrinomonadaceae bacterium]
MSRPAPNRPTKRVAAASLAAVIALAVASSAVAPGVAAQKPAPASTPRGPSREPFLHIETGMHTGPIKRIGVDSSGRFLVTASEDKTARVWELPSGRLLRVLRPPVGAGDEGKLYSIAISPDGRAVAAGGSTGFEWDGTHSVYIFDRESGRIERRVTGLPEAINHLAYSPDGRFLAATFAGAHGVRVYRTDDYSPAGEDKDYGGASYGGAFAPSGRLVVTSSDGLIRLYAPPGEGGLRLLAKRAAAGGTQPYTVSFSPDGSRLAVGFVDTTKVSVLSSADLSPLYEPGGAGQPGDSRANVAWSADGATLYAGAVGGGAGGGATIRAWADGGRGAHRDIGVPTSNTLTHILPLRGGGVVYGTYDPAFGAVDGAGRQTLHVGAATADNRNNQSGFLLSPDSTGVRFAYTLFGESPAVFSSVERKLDTAATAAAGWRAPVTGSDALRVTNWAHVVGPRLNGKPLRLGLHERSISVAVAPDDSAVLLGADWNLYLFDREGAKLWSVPAPGATLAVNVSADGRLAVAAFSDGTIRWYSMKDRTELLAFFPHADRKRWVAWTPSGYYDASPGAEELIGWHVNNGPDKAADFFPVAQFRETFYRPDVVAKVLKTRDEGVALKEANAARGIAPSRPAAEVAEILPPVVDILSPSDGEQVAPGEVTVRYRVRAPSGAPVTSVMALVDGRTVALEHSLNLSAGGDGVERRITVKIPERGASLVSVIASNRFAPSVAATARLAPATRPRDVTNPNPSPTPDAPRPALNVLAIGVGRYESGKIPGLKYPAKDAEAFAALMKGQEGRRYSKVTTRVLPDGAANRLEITKGLDWIRRETGEQDFAMIFFAGHGMTEDNLYYFLPTDADTEALTGTGVSFDIIVNTFLRIRGHKVLFIDTCRSGAVLGPRGVIDINNIANTLNKAQYGVAVFTASTGNESAEERDDWGNGAFTKALIEGLGGGASQPGAPEIYFSMLDTYLTRRVKELTNRRQTPTATRPLSVPDFPLALAH